MFFPLLRCRTALATTSSTSVVSSHAINLTKDTLYRPDGKSDCVEAVNSIYVTEETLPDWIITQIDSTDWVKGKLTCTTCHARLGSFDFVSGRKCTCGKFVLPPVHLIHSKLDFIFVEQNKEEIN